VKDYGTETGTVVLEITFYTTDESPVGTYSIRMIDYEGGKSCSFGICTESPIRVFKERHLTLEILPGRLNFVRRSTDSLARNPSGMQVVDVDADGVDDLLVLTHDDPGFSPFKTPTSSAVSFLPGKGNGTFRAEKIIDVPGLPITDILAVDIDDDGAVEVVTTHKSGHYGKPTATYRAAGVTIYEEPAGGTTGATTFIAYSHPGEEHWTLHSPQAADIDSDGQQELVIAGRYWGSGGINGGGAVVLQYRDGRPEFTGFYPYEDENQQLLDFKLSYINRDMNPDLVFSMGDGGLGEFEPKVDIYIGNSRGGFSNQANGSIVLQRQARFIEIMDFNNDDLNDIAASSEEVALGRGGAVFSEPEPFGVGGEIRSLATGDFDNDGLPDLFVATYTSTDGPSLYSGIGSISILRGDGVGGFARPISVRALKDVTDVATGDFNRDGLVDLAICDYQNRQVLVLLQQ
jgi:hypothetical protein